MKIVNAVSVLVTNGDKMLLGKRLSKVAKGYWSTPGGRQEPRESVIECAVRELREETHLITTAKQCENLGWGERFDWGGHYITAYVWVKDFAGAVKVMEPTKCAGWEWFSVGPHLPFPCTEPYWVTDKLYKRIKEEWNVARS